MLPPPQIGESVAVQRSPSSTEASRMAVAFQGEDISTEIPDLAYATLASTAACES
jgi:hypothetical protein